MASFRIIDPEVFDDGTLDEDYFEDSFDNSCPDCGAYDMSDCHCDESEEHSSYCIIYDTGICTCHMSSEEKELAMEFKALICFGNSK